MAHSPALRFLLGVTLASSVLFPTPAVAQPAAEPMFSEARVTAPVSTLRHAVAGGATKRGRLNPSVFRAARLSVTLPDGQFLVAERQEEAHGPRGEVSWVGRFEDAPGSLLVLTKHRGAVTGFFHHGTETYEVQGTETGEIVLFQVDEASLPDEGRPVPVGDAAASEFAAMAAEFSATGDPVVQDLLVVYTAASVSKAGNTASLESKIVNAVAAANAAYSNSAINLRLNLVGLSQVSYTETGDMGTSLSRLRTTGDGYMDTVHALRDSVGADLVSLVTDESNYCGIAYVMTSVSTSFASSAFSVVTQSCFSNQTLAHEIGHNQGNSHDRANGGSSAYAYGFGYRTCDNVAFTNGQSFRTVMGYPCSNVPRLNYFSNPNIYYKGAPMGVAHETSPSTSADNARSMNNTASTIAAFRTAPSTNPPAAPTNLTATATASDVVSLNWQDRSSDEIGFTLDRAIGGSDFSGRATLTSNAVNFSDSSLSPATTYHYRVRAFNEAGTSSWTSTASVTTPVAPVSPKRPKRATVAVTGSTALVAWSNVANEDAFHVSRERYNAKKGSWIASTFTVAANTRTLTQSLSNGMYRYSVSAVNAAGTSLAVIATCDPCTSDGSFTVGPATTGNDRGPGRADIDQL